MAATAFKFEEHGPWIPSISYKKYCQKCGLVALNNDFTSWAIKNGCNNSDHPQYEVQRAKAKS